MISKVLSKEQNAMIEIIDGKLDILLKNMDYNDYLKFLSSDDYISTYDNVLGYCDINYLPNAFFSGLTLDFLNKVLEKVDDKIKELHLI